MVKKNEDETTNEEAESLTGSGTPLVKVRAKVNIRGLALDEEAELPISRELEWDIEAGYLTRLDG